MHSTTIFLVDQDLISSMVVKSKLVENPSLNVSTFCNGQECVVNVQKKPAVVILDYSTKGLNGQNGRSTLMELQRQCPDTQIILMSTSHNREAVKNLAGDKMVHVSKGPNFSSQIKRLVEQMTGTLTAEQQVA
jgi:CheY-like chemotaxis protein